MLIHQEGKYTSNLQLLDLFPTFQDQLHCLREVFPQLSWRLRLIGPEMREDLLRWEVMGLQGEGWEESKVWLKTPRFPLFSQGFC